MVNYSDAQIGLTHEGDTLTLPNLRIRNDFGAILSTLIPLRVNVATMVSVLLILVAGAIVINDQITGRRAALAEAKASFEKLGGSVRLELAALNGPVESAVEATAASISLLPADNIISIDTVRLFSKRIVETD